MSYGIYFGIYFVIGVIATRNLWQSAVFRRIAAFFMSGLSVLTGLIVVVGAIMAACQDHVPNFAGQRSQIRESILVLACVAAGLLQLTIGLAGIGWTRRHVV